MFFIFFGCLKVWIKEIKGGGSLSWFAVAINGDTITVVVMDAKSSVNGVSKAGTPHGDPRTRLEGGLGNRSIADSDPALRDALQAALDSGKTRFKV
ncbi:hypothetical protein [Pseudomonas graminis]|uniref:hypothetical protein n=1 Tax=Pseudomonas graminis TaxID=158627 RepID=UPI001FCA4124|nr:hypothetical protein [Pseudomonas graminis]